MVIVYWLLFPSPLQCCALAPSIRHCNCGARRKQNRARSSYAEPQPTVAVVISITTAKLVNIFHSTKYFDKKNFKIFSIIFLPAQGKSFSCPESHFFLVLIGKSSRVDCVPVHQCTISIFKFQVGVEKEVFYFIILYIL